MFAISRQFFSRKPLFSLSFTSIKSSLPIQVRYSPSGYTNLVLSLPHQNQKIFFLNDKFTFTSLKEMFMLESPLSKIDIVYPTSMPLKDESNVLKFLKSQDSESVQILIDGHQYTLSNDSSFESNRFMSKVLKKAENNKNSIFYWYQFCLQNKIPKSNVGTIAYFMKLVNYQLEKHGLEKNMTKKDAETIFQRVLGEFGCPVNQNMDKLQEKTNELDTEILQLEKVKQDIEENAKRRMVLYQKLIFLVSMAQFLSFYYMIFHVEWLGKIYSSKNLNLLPSSFKKTKIPLNFFPRMGYHRTYYLHDIPINFGFRDSVFPEIRKKKGSSHNAGDFHE